MRPFPRLMKRFGLALLALSISSGCHNKGAPTGFERTASSPSSMGTHADFSGSAAPAAEPVSPRASEEMAIDADDAAVAQAPRRHRPGLGTEYGETRRSSVRTTSFRRGNSRPDVTLALWYNDSAGVAALQGHHGRSRTEAHISTSDGTFALSVVDERGRILSAADIGGKRYTIGAAGQRYRLGIENHSSERFEVVTSVDGLDVIDGEEAGFGKRGYILEPFSSVMIDGWRTSHDTVAAFRFGSIEDSYAERRGKGRNIGVIGAAFFHERGGVAWQDLHRRHNADPFPNGFAPPPPPRQRW